MKSRSFSSISRLRPLALTFLARAQNLLSQNLNPSSSGHYKLANHGSIGSEPLKFLSGGLDICEEGNALLVRRMGSRCPPNMLFGSSSTVQFSLSNGGWGATLAYIYAERQIFWCDERGTQDGIEGKYFGVGIF
ncbi:hypothetical protein AMTRI_Chr06g194820 [Amborella trichopoda]